MHIVQTLMSIHARCIVLTHANKDPRVLTTLEEEVCGWKQLNTAVARQGGRGKGPDMHGAPRSTTLASSAGRPYRRPVRTLLWP